jgi:hypothetical protein
MIITRTPQPSRSAARLTRSGSRRKSGPKRMLESLTALVPALAKELSRRSSSKKRSRGSKAGGIAIFSAAAGIAYKNRNKLMGMLKREGSDTRADEVTPPVDAGTRPTVSSGDPIRSGNIAPTDPGNRPDIPPSAG